MKTIGQKICFLREKHKLTKEELAKIVGISAGAVSKWELDLSKPKVESSVKLANYFGITLDSLTNSSIEIKFKEKMVVIPFYHEVEASAGNGAEVFNESYEELSIQACFIPNAESTIALKVCGDSMEPIFANDSIVFVDKSLINVIDGKVYVFIHDGMVRIKELQRTPRGFKLKSYNNNYQTENVDISCESIKIVGRVVGQLQMFY
ncbi:XRE family transcriptional regulator [Vibrio parahaemolyticus]|uniref:XRE family transcriptional regulator n=1 Tax=Vibrio parahaemolyticus TaxID=670 RepID=UPI00215BC0C5|nr:LexA family transcriptional regulator [Vibrio parahaemolyticus]MCR9819742.1 LexA family transcriptional regulator [Vibrio parahaemolyticus]